MTGLVSPLHSEVVGLANIRFFAPPSSGREFPWPSLDDVFAAMALDQSLRDGFKQSLPGSEWTAHTRMVATLSGITMICAHHIAQGTIDAMTQAGRCPANLYARYTKAGADALCKMTEGYSKAELFAYLKAALAAGGGLA